MNTKQQKNENKSNGETEEIQKKNLLFIFVPLLRSLEEFQKKNCL